MHFWHSLNVHWMCIFCLDTSSVPNGIHKILKIGLTFHRNFNVRASVQLGDLTLDVIFYFGFLFLKLHLLVCHSSRGVTREMSWIGLLLVEQKDIRMGRWCPSVGIHQGVLHLMNKNHRWERRRCDTAESEANIGEKERMWQSYQKDKIIYFITQLNTIQ